MATEPSKFNSKGTARLEAFSDGVFSIAITLLVFNLHAPDLQAGQSLFQALLDQWASYFAFLISFATIGIMWINHHNLFKLINRSDHTLMILNGLLLLLITFLNYPMAVLGEYIQDPDEGRVAAGLFSMTSVLIAIAYNALWRYAAYKRRLIDPAVPQELVDEITAAYRYGPLLYLVALIMAFFSVAASLAVSAGLAIFFALPSKFNSYGDD